MGFFLAPPWIPANPTKILCIYLDIVGIYMEPGLRESRQAMITFLQPHSSLADMRVSLGVIEPMDLELTRRQLPLRWCVRTSDDNANGKHSAPQPLCPNDQTTPTALLMHDVAVVVVVIAPDTTRLHDNCHHYHYFGGCVFHLPAPHHGATTLRPALGCHHLPIAYGYNFTCNP